MYWKKLSQEEISQRVNEALANNLNFRTKRILGIPGSYLDEEQFYDDAPFLEDSPFLKTLIANPNHIGCHTLGDSTEPFFAGTQSLERELIKICAEQIFEGNENEQDGYVAAGGTEANIQAMWIYRNYFVAENDARNDEIAVVYSEDSHYSMSKGANLLNINSIVVNVDDNSREWVMEDLENKINQALLDDIKYFVVVANMSTTMFGSVDDVNKITSFFKTRKVQFKLHVDGAFGGFIYPFTNSDSNYNFRNEDITSFTLDGHKMLQSPYGTGVFLIRKGYMKYALTEEASYVKGKDYTICGSRSGANAVALWMILQIHGSEGLKVKMNQLKDRTISLNNRLKRLGLECYQNPFVNIVTIRSTSIPENLAKKYSLVPDRHENPNWYKIVLMAHVKQGVIDSFIADLKTELINI